MDPLFFTESKGQGKVVNGLDMVDPCPTLLQP